MVCNSLLITNQKRTKTVNEMKRTKRQTWPLIVVLMMFISPLIMVELSNAWNNSVDAKVGQTELIEYASYIGGSLTDRTYRLLCDSEGNPILIGDTFSSDFPEALEPNPSIGSTSTFIAKFNADNLTELLFSTVLGGPSYDTFYDVVLDEEDNMYLCGATLSTSGFATPGAYDTTHGGGPNDGFISKIASNGSLIWATYLGGTGNDNVAAIELDSSNNIWVAGSTRSNGFPVSDDAFDKVYEVDQPLPDPWGTKGECFLTKISNNGSKLLYSSFLGGEAKEGLEIMQIDDLGNIIVSGRTTSNDFPISENAWDKHLAGEDDIFLSKFSSNGSELLYSTFIGGTESEVVFGIDLDSDGNIILGGVTNSSDFPISANAYDKTFDGISDAFILKILSDASSLVFSTYLGGSGPGTDDPLILYSDFIGVVEFNEATSDIHFAGDTDSIDWPSTDGSTLKGTLDATIGILSADGSKLKYSTLIGGSDTDWITGCYLGINSNQAYVAPWTNSSDFPVTSDAYQSTSGGDFDTTLMKITFPEIDDTTTTTTATTATTTTTNSDTLSSPTTEGASAFEFIMTIPLLVFMALSIHIVKKRKKS